jgi:hypothetical protein
MLRSAKDIISTYKLLAKDGEIGKIKDFFFNDIFWTIRYLVVDTGKWLQERLVLISPTALGKPDWNMKFFPVNMTKNKIEQSPSVEKDKPVSKQREDELMTYYTWPVFTYGIETAHFAEMEIMAERLKKAEEENNKKESDEKNNDDPHLRSNKEVSGYSIHALDGSIGHVEDFIFNNNTWIIRYMVIDTRSFLPGRKVLVSPEWIKNVDWLKKEVLVEMTRDSIKKSPEFDPAEPVNRAYELKLYDYYGRPTYWDNVNK